VGYSCEQRWLNLFADTEIRNTKWKRNYWCFYDCIMRYIQYRDCPKHPSTEIKRNSKSRFCPQSFLNGIMLWMNYTMYISNTPTTKKGIIPHKKIKERKAHNNCLRKTSNNNRRKTKASTAHSSITTTLMD
jgi:hypothetical protein